MTIFIQGVQNKTHSRKYDYLLNGHIYIKYHFDIKGSYLVFFTLKVMMLEVGYIMVKMNILALLPYKWYEPPYIVTIKITRLTTGAKSFFFVINQIQVTSNKKSQVTRSHKSTVSHKSQVTSYK